MEDLFELFFRGIIDQFLGLYTRYYFFKLIRRKKTIAHLKGEDTKDGANAVMQNFLNNLVGIIVVFLLFLIVAFFYGMILYGT